MGSKSVVNSGVRSRIVNLEELVGDGVYEFAYVAACLKLRGATGSPVADFLTGVVNFSRLGTITNEKDIGRDIEWYLVGTNDVDRVGGCSPGVGD